MTLWRPLRSWDDKIKKKKFPVKLLKKIIWCLLQIWTRIDIHVNEFKKYFLKNGHELHKESSMFLPIFADSEVRHFRSSNFNRISCYTGICLFTSLLYKSCVAHMNRTKDLILMVPEKF